MDPARHNPINIAEACLTPDGDHPDDRTAFRFLAADGRRTDLSYGELRHRSMQFAGVLAAAGVGPGDHVFVLLRRGPALPVTVLGALAHRTVVGTLFASLGPEAVRQRLTLGSARVVVTTPALYRHAVAPVRHLLPHLQHVFVVGTDSPPPGTIALDPLLTAAPGTYEIGPTAPDDAALLHFTSGTTGEPKAAVHGHGALVALRSTATTALGLRSGDVFWCTADPGWVTGTAYGLLAPLALGVTSVVDEADFDAARWTALLHDERIGVWYTAPTALRMLRRLTEGTPLGRFPALRLVASVGEPLDTSTAQWAHATFGAPVHDTWWQTETGSIMIATPFGADRPGAMGRALPGVDAAVLRRAPTGAPVTHDGRVEHVRSPAESGELALRPEWPSMFLGYLGDPERTAACFVDGWYRTGDLVRRGADGWFWFVGRADDVIETGGHLVGPFEVERVLRDHPAVADAAVVGRPDDVLGERVVAVVVLRRPGGATAEELVAFARRELGPTLAPREIEFTDRLPLTRSGKIRRGELRARGTGHPTEAPPELHPDLRRAVLDALAAVAPETDLERLPGDADLREHAELDSMDFLAFVEHLHATTGITVRPRDYPWLVTVDGAVELLAQPLEATP